MASQWRRLVCAPLEDRAAHSIQLLVDIVNILQVCDQLPHYGAIRESEDFGVLRHKHAKGVRYRYRPVPNFNTITDGVGITVLIGLTVQVWQS